MHFTCEVFICYRGEWRVMWGFNPDEKSTLISEGDIVSVPTWIYRGFSNVGIDDGFLFTGLGRDDTGGILWGPWTIEKAAEAGVYLTDQYRIVDTRRGDALTKDEKLLKPMTPSEIAALEDWSPERMSNRIVRHADLAWQSEALLDSALDGHGAQMASVIGLGMHQGRAAMPPVANAHGMSIEWMKIPPGGQVGRHRLTQKQAIVIKQGTLDLTIEATDGLFQQTLIGSEKSWDSYAIQEDHWRRLHNAGSSDVLLMVMTSGD